jgi:hypothetical protein
MTTMPHIREKECHEAWKVSMLSGRFSISASIALDLSLHFKPIQSGRHTIDLCMAAIFSMKRNEMQQDRKAAISGVKAGFEHHMHTTCDILYGTIDEARSLSFKDGNALSMCISKRRCFSRLNAGV